MNDLEIATLAAALILVASMFSVELGISTAIIEIAFGVIAGNFAHVTSTPWIDFIASFASVLLTFLAGAEVDPRILRERPQQAVAIGALSFLAPFVATGLFAYFLPAGISNSRRSPGSLSRQRRSLLSTRYSWRLA